MAKMKRVSVEDLLRWSPMRRTFDMDDIRQHPSYDAETDTIEVYKSHVDTIELNKEMYRFRVTVTTPVIRDMTEAMNKMSQAMNKIARRKP